MIDKHTLPWRYSDKTGIVLDAKGHIVMSYIAWATKEDMRRIVASVNKCADMSLEDLEHPDVYLLATQMKTPGVPKPITLPFLAYGIDCYTSTYSGETRDRRSIRMSLEGDAWDAPGGSLHLDLNDDLGRQFSLKQKVNVLVTPVANAES